MGLYEIGLAVLGLTILAAAVLPRLLEDRPVSFPIVYVGIGMGLFALPLGLPDPDPLHHGELAERLTEFGVIVALMGAGLKLDRPPSLQGWRTTWRLLAITMPLTIAMVALLGWWTVGIAIPSAVLLGAVIAPTDPVLASDVQVDPPAEGTTDEVRFGLTSEAGLNDGLAFPFTNLAIALAVVGLAPHTWLQDWLLIDVAYRILAGVLIGAIVGRVLAQFVFAFPASTRLATTMAGTEALAATLVSYSLTELVGGYGFIAVFVAAVVLRDYERPHEYYQELHDFAEIIERLVMAVLLILFGGAVVTGLLTPLTWKAIIISLIIVLVVRPLAGVIGLTGYPLERNAIAFFGIRGIGSFYYLSYGLNHASFTNMRLLWAVVGFTVLSSMIIHGVTATPVMRDLNRELQDVSTEA